MEAPSKKSSTKQTGDIAEQAVILKLLQLGLGVLRPIGDRLPYDLAVDIGGQILRIQIKSAWEYPKWDCYVVDTRRSKTNRKVFIREKYKENDFDFAVLYIAPLSVFYVIPAKDFNNFKSNIALVENQKKRQRPPKSANYREAWHLIFK